MFNPYLNFLVPAVAATGSEAFSCNITYIVSVKSLAFMALTHFVEVAWWFCSQEKLYQWIRRQQEEGSRVLTVDIINYLQVLLSIHPA